MSGESDPLSVLTARERECLRLVAVPLRTKEIALQLGLAPNYIDGLISSGTRKLGASSRAEAARILTAAEGKGKRLSEVGFPFVAAASADPPIGVADAAVLLRDDEAPFHSEPFARISTAEPVGKTRRNDLDRWARLAIMLAITIGLVIALGTAASTLEVISRLIG